MLILTCIARPMLTAGRAIIGVHAWDSVAKRERVNMMNRFHEISHTFRGYFQFNCVPFTLKLSLRTAEFLNEFN